MLDRSVVAVFAAGLLALTGCRAPDHEAPVALAAVARDLTTFAAHHQRELDIPGIWVAVLDVDPATGVSHTWSTVVGSGGAVDAVHRVASIGKLHTATAAMVLAGRGQLDLDAPVTRYLPEFRPHNPFGGDITLRHLLGHRSGLGREAPVGHYFDPHEPSLAATVASLNGTVLATAPGSEFRYSNAGLGVVGEVLARVTGQPFEQVVQELVLAPLGLCDSDFVARPDLLRREVRGRMWTYDGRAITTPGFGFGYAPAANLRATLADLLRFASSWLPQAPRRVLAPAAQASMWQLPPDQGEGCGLGFFVSTLAGERVVGHDGVVYGSASTLRAMPSQGLVVAVACTLDFATAVADAVADRALLALLANRRGERLPAPEFPQRVPRELADSLTGHWLVGADWVDLTVRDGELYYDPDIGVRTRLRLAADGALVSDDPLSLGGRRLRVLPDGHLHDGEAEYVRSDLPPPPAPADLLPLLGEYGHDHDVLIVYEDHGQLGVLVEWVVRDLPARVRRDRYRFSPGMYGNDWLEFERDGDGRVVAAVVGGARFLRRPDAAPGGFRVPVQRPVHELVQAAATALPPMPAADERASDLVELAALDATLRFDLKYATADNFVGAAVYPAGARAMLQRPAAEALVRVQRALSPRGLGLLVFDGYRPWSVTRVFWEATPPALRDFVADPAHGSRHNRGCAVDLTLCDLATGAPLPMPSDFDEFTERAYPDHPGGTSLQRYWRETLRRAMAKEGFTVNSHEWWHFDFVDWARYPVGNAPLPGGR